MERSLSIPARRVVAIAAVVALASSLVAWLPLAVRSVPVVRGADTCQLASANDDIQHVIHIQFDNTHLLRDNPNVPSDLEQMPHLLDFIRNNGTMLTNDHTVLISHTATGILSTLTGVYPDRMGQPVSNSFRYFTPSGGPVRASRLPIGLRRSSIRAGQPVRPTSRPR
jgi:predicted PurR-regulated permease PerM